MDPHRDPSLPVLAAAVALEGFDLLGAVADAQGRQGSSGGLSPRAERAGGAAEPLARTHEEHFRRDLLGKTNLAAVHTVENERCYAEGDIVGIRENLATGVRVPLRKIRPIALSSALEFVADDQADELRRVWAITCKRTCPGKVFKRFVALYGDGAYDVATAWRCAWAFDADALRLQCQRCGSGTMEVVLRTDGDGVSVAYHRERCKSARCAHCGVRIVAPKWKVDLLAQLAHDREEGRDHLWGTLTVDPGAWCAEQGEPVCQASAVLCQRWAAERFGEVIETLRSRWPDLEYFRALELHDSQWPHIHFILRGGITKDALEEATRRGRGDTWDGVLRYAFLQRREQKEARERGEKQTARCPFSRLRADVRDTFVAFGFGKVFDLSAVDVSLADQLVPYMTGGLFKSGKGKRLADPMAGSAEALAGELTKGRQRAERLLARGVRVFEASRAQRGAGGRTGFFDAVPVRDRTPKGVLHSRKLNRPLEAVRAALKRVGVDVGAAQYRPDFTGPVPDAGQRRPKVAEAFEAGASMVELLQAQLVEAEPEPPDG